MEENMTSELTYNAPNWVKDAIFYQIFPDRFCNGNSLNDPENTAIWGDLPTRDNFFGGDLEGIIQKLDYLQGLGINALYLNPIFKARTNHRYDTSDYFQVDPVLGTNTLLKELVNQAHQRSMHILLDGVFNHCGDSFAPFLDVTQKGASSEYADWFIVRGYPLQKHPLNYLTCGGCEYLPKFNHQNRSVQEYILKVGDYWLKETGVDGWRLDVPFKVPVALWKEFRKTIKKTNPQAYLVGEIWREGQSWLKGDLFDGVTNYRLRDLIYDFVLTNLLDGEDFGYELQTLLTSHGPAAFSMLNLLDSHDTPRVLTSFKGDIEKLRLAMTLLMTLPGAPMIYYGDEIGLLGETDPDCRRCFPWDETTWNQQILSFTKSLISLRKSHPCFRRGIPQRLAVFNGLFAFQQTYKNDEALVVINTREAIPTIKIPITSQAKLWQDYATQQVYPAYSGYLIIDKVLAKSSQVLLPVY